MTRPRGYSALDVRAILDATREAIRRKRPDRQYIEHVNTRDVMLILLARNQVAHPPRRKT